MHPRQPDRTGFVDRDGVRIYYEVHGDGDPTFLLLPSWSIVHSRVWKMQVPYLSHHGRVVLFDGRGNGRSDRPRTPESYRSSTFAADALAVMDATGTRNAVGVGLSAGARWLLELAHVAPERVLGAVFLAPALPLTSQTATRDTHPFDERLDTTEGWAKFNRHYWLEHYPDFLRFFFGRCLTEPHSTKPIEDAVGWGLETDPETLIATMSPPADGEPDRTLRPDAVRELAATVRCPVLVIHGTEDDIRPHEGGAELARLAGGDFVSLQGSGHLPHARDPVRVNLELRAFAERTAPRCRRTRTWTRAARRTRRALFISSPIGLGHIQRDLAIARRLRRLQPDLEIHWWAQHPVTRVLEEAGEYVHPASHAMSSESRHWEEEANAHELHAFYAFRRMDEILLHNFMLFDDLVSSEPYDLWIGDEAWETDHYLHENPERKRAPYVFLTDVIGFLPVDPQGDEREVELTSDYNAEMIEQRARTPWVRDLSLYVGEYDDLPDATFGPGLPGIRDWARQWFDEVGYVLPFDPAAYLDTAALRERLGYEVDGTLLFAAVGGTAVGRSLLGRVAEAFELLRRRRPDARMIMVTGPRIDPADLPEVPGLEKRPYVHDLFEHLACADAAVVQGGLSTTMELVATERPFVYFPLRNHWEQVHHVSARLRRYGAGEGLDYATTDAEALARALETRLHGPVSYRRVSGEGAARAAQRISALLERRAG